MSVCLWSCQGKDETVVGWSLTCFLWPTGDSYRANAELSLEQEQRLRNNLIWSHHCTFSAAAHTPDTSAYWSHALSQNPDSEGNGPVSRGAKNCSGSLLTTRSPKPGWYCSLGMALRLTPKGLWSMDYDSPGFVQLSSSCIRRPNLSWILAPSSWVRINQFLGMDYGPVPHLK